MKWRMRKMSIRGICTFTWTPWCLLNLSFFLWDFKPQHFKIKCDYFTCCLYARPINAFKNSATNASHFSGYQTGILWSHSCALMNSPLVCSLDSATIERAAQKKESLSELASFTEVFDLGKVTLYRIWTQFLFPLLGLSSQRGYQSVTQW